ncbi:MAG: zinc ribbon domain-containing protein [Gemmatimonadaceae bacterium]|nr:zinc ribbon domain-containing protein [Gemmatimonadaceae bacterium]
MTSPSTEFTKCPVCDEPATGRFCANCGATLAKVSCTECGAPLSPGALFCHRCGKRVGRGSEVPAPQEPATLTPVRKEKQSLVPWAIAAVALLAALATLAGRGFNASRGSTLDAPQNALPQAGLDDRAAAPVDPNVRGPDISSLSPQERADRLYTRVMILNSEGKTDSVQFFAPMALVAYQMLEPLNADQRYDMGRIAEVAGQLDAARAQADTILKGAPTHLLGLILAGRASELLAQPAQKAEFARRLLAAEKSELATKKPEYERHEDDIKRAVADARTAGTKR